MIKILNHNKKRLNSMIKNLYILLWTAIEIISNIHPPENYYFVKARDLQKEKSHKDAIKILKIGVKNYPDSARIHTMLANLYLDQKKRKHAIRHLYKVLEIDGDRATPVIYGKLSKVLRNRKKYKDALKVIESGLRIYPTNRNILLERSELAIINEDWSSSLEILNNVFDTNKGSPPVRAYLNMYKASIGLKDIKKAERIIEHGIHEYPKNKSLLLEYSNIAIFHRKWKLAIKRMESLIKNAREKISSDEYYTLLALNQIIGDCKKVDQIINILNDTFKEDDKKNKINNFKKFILFDNGESRIEFYKQYRHTDSVCITFDSINIEWDQPSFGFNFLLKQNVDIIAVRRRSKTSYQQDLSIEDFYKTVKVLAEFYQNKMAYGFSLGGYSALYYGSSLNCNILSLSPRNSAHPIYGEDIEGDIEFNHQLSHNINPNISPIIAYDPKNDIDKEYIEQELKVSYPNAVFLEFPYAGHRIAPFFLQVGILKDVVQRVMNNEPIPTYKNLPLEKSHQYLRVLGNACLRKNKPRWALSLGERAVNVAPKDVQSNLLKIRALINLGKKDEALKELENAQERIPNNNIINSLINEIV